MEIFFFFYDSFGIKQKWDSLEFIIRHFLCHKTGPGGANMWKSGREIYNKGEQRRVENGKSV